MLVFLCTFSFNLSNSYLWQVPYFLSKIEEMDDLRSEMTYLRSSGLACVIDRYQIPLYEFQESMLLLTLREGQLGAGWNWNGVSKKNVRLQRWWFSLQVVSNTAAPWTVLCTDPLSMGFPRQEYWSGLPFPSPGDLPDSGIEPGSSSLHWDSLPTEPAEKPLRLYHHYKNLEVTFPFPTVPFFQHGC